MSIETMKLALEALELAGGNLCEALNHPKKLQHGIGEPCPAVAKYDAAITSLRQAIEQAEKRPAPMSEPNRIVAYSAAEKLRSLGYQWDEKAAAWQAQKQEPVAWITQGGKGWLRWHKSYDDNKDSVPLYESPPQRQWVGLTDEERNDCLVSADPCECLAEPEAHQLITDVEAKLKQKNGYAEEKNT